MRIFAASTVMPISSSPIAHGGILVENGRIRDVGPVERLRSDYDAPVTDFPQCVIMPGLVNAHTHLELTHFPSWKLRKDLDYSPRTYVDWVIQVIKIKRSLQPEELELSLKEGLRKSLESGTVASADILTDRRLLPIYDETPTKNIVFLEAIGQEPALCAELKEKLKVVIRSGHTRFGISPHAPHTLSPSFFREIKELATSFSLPIMTHLSESSEEASFMHDSTGRIAELLYPHIHWEAYLPKPQRTTSTAYLDSLGVLDQSTIAVHCVHVTPADGEILKKRGVNVVICPRSNDRLTVGKAPLNLFKKLDIPMAIGTDSLASNDSLSLWDEMRFILNEFPGVFRHDELLAMATLGGAKVLGIDEEFGSLEQGKRADFLVLEVENSMVEKNLHRLIIEEARIDQVYISGNHVN
ncbi:amidohydrolase family protein [Geotalea toluenoxydans]|uniref:amidohydrolase family protein n=1 Tax=Geotalea toluenoxydans TaxID=421624 RepID=UPI0006D0BA2F|nr:amidohydrolase family protein [Geotalea toluenoxydans]